jgi:glycosyltransferase involved in cell wall biosynthesis
MVMPLENVKFQAGVTAILECLAMGKAVICSRVPGQTDVVVEGENGRYVPPGDPLALRAEIRRMLDHSQETNSLGTRGRQLIEQQMNLDLYSERLTDVLREAIDEAEIS